LKRLLHLGGIGSLLQAVYFVAVVLFLAVIMPSQGFRADDTAYHDPAAALSFALKSPIRAISELLDVVLGVSLVVTTIALYEKFQVKLSGRKQVMVTAAIVGATFSFASGLIGFITIPELAGMYAQGQVEANAAYLTVTLITGALRLGAIFAYGWWVLMVSWIAYTTQQFSKPLNYVGLLLGVLGIINFTVQPVAIVTLVLGVVWSIWLGIGLLRQ
jgi:hypothetical protein